jgi:Ca-activated chloride channel family protein
MPVTGNLAGDALRLGEQLLDHEGVSGGILFVTDTLDPADIADFNSAQVPVVILSMLPEVIQDRGFGQLTKPVIQVVPEGSDIRQIERQLNAAYRAAALENTAQPWKDQGFWLAWPAALLMLIWFRRGWTMRWALAVGLAFCVTAPQPTRANGIADWFFTPDQQGWRAFQQKDFTGAADRFADPIWRGYALYRSGQYEKSIEVLGRIGTVQSAFIQGMAHIKSRGYRDAVRAFETAMELDPSYPGVVENLAVAREIVDYIERVREQSDTGEEAGIGADDVVFDNEAGRGTETQIEVAQEEGIGVLTTEQWMNTVDTRTADFLRQRFAIEAASRTDAAERTQ